MTPPDRPSGAGRRESHSLKVLLVCGASSSGKTYATERVVAIHYDVATARADRFYERALNAAGVPQQGMRHLGREARRLRESAYDQRTREEFWRAYADSVRRHLQQAFDWGVTPVLEGSTLARADEVRRIMTVTRDVGGSDVEVFRLQLTPSLRKWNRNRGSRVRWETGGLLPPADRRSYEQRMAAARPEPVAGVQDLVADGSSRELERLLEEVVRLRPHRWYQRFSLGPVDTSGPSDSSDKSDAVLVRDVAGKRILDYCCAAGAVAFLLKQRGAAEVIGIEKDPLKYCKGLELRNTLRRHSQLDAEVDFRLGDACEVLPTLSPFDTVVFFGALHYFPDYEGTLAAVANAAREAVYVEFNFSEREHHTAGAPDGVHPYVRSRGGQTVYMGNRDTVERIVALSMRGFEVEERFPISPPGARQRHEREVWRMRRSSAGARRQPASEESRAGSWPRVAPSAPPALGLGTLTRPCATEDGATLSAPTGSWPLAARFGRRAQPYQGPWLLALAARRALT